MSNVMAHWPSLDSLFNLHYYMSSLQCHAGCNPATITALAQTHNTYFIPCSVLCYHLNIICDLVRGVVSTQDVNSVPCTHCPGIEPGTLKRAFALPDTRLWTETVDLQQTTDQEQACWIGL